MAAPAADTVVLGTSRPREDSLPKVRGAVRYVADQRAAGLLHARLVLAADAHARLRAVEREDALAVPGVVAVLTAADLPLAEPSGSRAGEPLARDEIVFAGQPVAIVLGETEAAAEDGAELVVLDTEPLSAVVDIQEAMRPGAPRVRLHAETDESDLGSAHAAVGGSGDEEARDEELSENVVLSRRHEDGDAAGAIAASAAVAEGRFETQWIHQSYLETQAATAYPDADGSLTVEASTQGAFSTRSQLADVLGLPLGAVRVVPLPQGGSFGGKLLIVEPLAAAAALAVGRPVRLQLTRSEDFLATNPAPDGVIDLRIGATADGALTGLEARIAFARGAVHSWGVESVAAALAGGVYRWRAFDVRTYGVETNRVSFGAYRAPGAPPAAFALESLMDELAAKLGLDRAELRARNVVRQGDTRADGKPWGPIGAEQCLKAARSHELWQRRDELPAGEGVGLGIGVWPGASDSAGAVCRLEDDGTIAVVTAFTDMTGVNTTFAAIAAEVIGVEPERVRIVPADTSTAPRAPLSGGSKATYGVGRAVAAAAEDARAQLLEIAAAELEVAPEDLEIVDGNVQARGAPSTSVKLKKLGRRVAAGRYAPVEGRGRVASVAPAPSVAAHLAHVRIDPDTGRVDVLAWVIAQDVGRALNPALCEGQMHGGVAQAIGWALHEELVSDEDGHVLNGSFASYGLPGASDVPPIETILVEVPAPDGPFGAKGIGEAPVVAGPAAVANAIAAATGARLRELPMTPERVAAALHAPR